MPAGDVTAWSRLLPDVGYGGQHAGHEGQEAIRPHLKLQSGTFLLTCEGHQAFTWPCTFSLLPETQLCVIAMAASTDQSWEVTQ